MRSRYHKNFQRQLFKLPVAQQKRARQAVSLFEVDPRNPTLRNHRLGGEWYGYHSISAGGDLRLHYKLLDEQMVLFVAVGSHSQLYG